MKHLTILMAAALLFACSPKSEAPAESAAPSEAAPEALSEPAPVESEPALEGDAPEPDAAGAAPGAHGGMCLGVGGVACTDAGDYCALTEGACLTPDASGTCTAKPEACTMQYDPVCGCDSKTYGNACEAASAGVSVGSKGECPKTE